MIIDCGTPALGGLLDNFVYLVCALGFVQFGFGTQRCQSLFQLVQGFIHSSLETGKISLTFADHLNQNYYFLVVFVQSLETFDHPISKSFECASL